MYLYFIYFLGDVVVCWYDKLIVCMTYLYALAIEQRNKQEFPNFLFFLENY